MGAKRTIPVSALKCLIKAVPKIIHEKDCHAWACCRVHEQELIDPVALIARIDYYMTRRKNEKRI